MGHLSPQSEYYALIVSLFDIFMYVIEYLLGCTKTLKLMLSVDYAMLNKAFISPLPIMYNGYTKQNF